MMKMKNDFVKRMTERMFHHSLVSFYIALQYCLSVSVPVCVCVLFVPTVGPMGAGRSPLGLLLLPFHSRFWALTLKPKKKKEEKHDVYITNEEGISSNSAILCVLYQCTLKYTLSRLLMKMILPKQYL